MIKDGSLLLEGCTGEVVDRYRMVEFFATEGVMLGQACDGLIVLKGGEDRWQALLDRHSSAQDWLQTHGARDISLTSVTLEEMFVALARAKEAA
jgi:hypothetical protein